MKPVFELKAIASQSPIACSLSGTDQFKQREEAFQKLLGSCQAIEELEDGYKFKFESSEAQVQAVVAFVLAERSCCPFLTFVLVFEPDSGPVWLFIHGEEGFKVGILPMVGLVAKNI